MKEIFLLDANTFITPYRRYYSFDFAMGFWNQLEEKLKLPNVFVLDVVVSELTKSEDQLSEWIQGLEDFQPLSTKTEPYVENYSEVLKYVQTCGLYKTEALRNWSQFGIADPWLIAVAMEKKATIITSEVSVKNLSAKSKSKNAKIPDVASHFGITCHDLFYFMRQMQFKL